MQADKPSCYKGWQENGFDLYCHYRGIAGRALLKKRGIQWVRDACDWLDFIRFRQFGPKENQSFNQEEESKRMELSSLKMVHYSSIY